MGLLAGILSKDQSDISEFLYKMAFKLRHRGNSSLCLLAKDAMGWQSIICKSLKEILETKASFGIVGSHLILDTKNETIPYVDCQENDYLLLDGRIFNNQQIQNEMKEKHRGNLNNSGIIIHFVEELLKKNYKIPEILKKLFNLIEGMYAGTLILKDQVFLFRDLIGIKPLYLNFGPKYIAFASEKKALWIAGFKQNIKPLIPGYVVRITERGFPTIYNRVFNNRGIDKQPLQYYCNILLKLLNDNLLKLEPKNPFYLLLSGGIDSSLLAAALKSKDIKFNSLVIGSERSKDIPAAQDVANFLDLPLEIKKFDVTELEKIIPLLIYSLESTDEKKINIAFPLFFASNYLQDKGYKVIFTGQGADEIFGGYERHEIKFKEDPNSFQGSLWEDIKNLPRVNLQRDDAVSMANTVELRLPYLNRRFVEFCMQIPPSFKIKPPIRKFILRQVGKKIGLSDKIIQIPKRAIQFSSGSYEILKKLAKKYGFTKNFALNNGFFSPTQLFIDSLSYFIGFPNIEPKVIKFMEKSSIKWPESFFKYKNIVNS
ncbi:MAG: hypothetical protein HWN67_16605 [Candidatus Helarchaeota archaeon]|nr:hypothetical protein [Candidatus Helarchaeota archaeon]